MRLGLAAGREGGSYSCETLVPSYTCRSIIVLVDQKIVPSYTRRSIIVLVDQKIDCKMSVD